MTKQTLSALACLLFLAPAGFSAGLRIGFMDSFAVGRGNAFAATADNPSAIFYNPAGLTQLEESELSGGVLAMQFSSRHTVDGTTTKMRDRFLPVPHFYFGHKAKESPVAVGIGAYLPFGLITEWPDDAPFRGLATRSELTYLRINPVVSYQVNPQLSVGGGLTINQADIELRRGIPGAPGAEYRFEGDDDALGFNLGIRWQPTVRHAFGASYHSPTRVRFSGTDRVPGFQGDASLDRLTFPEIVIVGYSFRPTREWNFETNIDWTRWSRFDSTTLRSGLGDEQLPLHWNSTFFYSIGATRYLPNNHFLSGGYVYTDNAVPAETFNPFLPDSRFHFFSLGFGSTGKPFTWQAAYHYAHGPAREIPESNLHDRDPGGRYENRIHSFALTLALNF